MSNVVNLFTDGEVLNDVRENVEDALNGIREIDLKTLIIANELYLGQGISYVYFIRNPYNNLIKIGTTDNIKKRISQLKNYAMNSIGEALDFKLLAVIPVIKDLKYSAEKIVHSDFSDSRMHGEWFNIEDSYLSEYIDDASVVEILGVDILFSSYFYNENDLKLESKYSLREYEYLLNEGKICNKTLRLLKSVLKDGLNFKIGKSDSLNKKLLVSRDSCDESVNFFLTEKEIFESLLKVVKLGIYETLD